VAGTCDPATGVCSNPAAPDGTSCTDGDACTQSDTCVAGACTGGAPDPACASADLSLKLGAAPKRPRLGKEVTYTARARNLGPAEAMMVMVEMTCVGVPYHVVETSMGCVTAGSTTTCDLGTLSPHGNGRASISVAPESTGVLTCTARVSSSTADPDLGNQSMSVATEVR
jgi:hypothetical protein